MSDQLVVMNQGEIEEIGDADVIYKAPKQDIQKHLLPQFLRGFSLF